MTVPDRQWVESVAKHPRHAEKADIRAGMAQTSGGELFINPGAKLCSVSRAVIAFVKGEKIEMVTGKQPTALRWFCQSIDIEQNVEDTIDEFISLWPRPPMHDLANI